MTEQIRLKTAYQRLVRMSRALVVVGTRRDVFPALCAASEQIYASDIYRKQEGRLP